MKNMILLLIGVGVILDVSGLAAQGQAPVSSVPAPASKEVGRVLVLDNERTMTGEITREGDRYRIKRLIGETWLPASKVLTLCATLEEAYQFLERRANLNDPDERLRLSEWCRQHGLRQHAVTQAEAAAKLRPADERIRRILTYLKEAKERAVAPPAPTPTEAATARVEVTADSLGMFASRVQPILMNACVRCHTAGRGGCFQLTRVQDTGLGNRRSLEKNLATVLAQVNTREPRASKLLQKAVSIHAPGMTQAPLQGRRAPAYQSLEWWVVRTVENNPQLRDDVHASVSAPGVPAPRPDAPRWGEERDRPEATKPRPPITPAAPSTTPPAPPAATPPTPPATPAATVKPPVRPEGLDPVDPEGFNREFHPMRGASPAEKPAGS